MRLVIPLLLAALAALCVPAAAAQSPIPCVAGMAQAELDASDVRARLFNMGGLFWRGGAPLYEVPKNSGLSPAFAAGVWLGGYLDADLRVAGATYSDFEFVPGPLANAAVPPEACEAYDRIWLISQRDVQHYEATGTASEDLRDWPAALGAPVVDGDGDPDTYDLAGGDRPFVLGTQTAFWVMNDGGEHPSTGSEPLGVEIQVLAWAADSPSAALDQATYYRYRVVNRNAAPIDSLVFTFWNDADLGEEFADDYIGSDPARDLLYFYNADDQDVGGYGSPPPAWGVQLLDAPAGSAMYFTNSSADTPQEKADYWNYMNSRFRLGQPLTYGGDGTNPNGDPTSFLYPNEPGTYWSEPCPTPGCGAPINPDDRRGLLSSVPQRLEAGASRDYTVALPFAFGTQNYGPGGSVEALKAAADQIQAAFDAGAFGTDAEAAPETAAVFALGAPYPNPASGRLSVPYFLAEVGAVRMAVYDVLGRRVALAVDGPRAAASDVAVVETDALSAGVYVVVLEAGGQRAASRFTVVR